MAEVEDPLPFLCGEEVEVEDEKLLFKLIDSGPKVARIDGDGRDDGGGGDKDKFAI